jgi:2-dehydro-3-deoxygluconokinase
MEHCFDNSSLPTPVQAEPKYQGAPMSRPLQVAFFGECMLELQGAPFGDMRQTMGGDTWNSAIYLRRCSPPSALAVHFVSALGDDPLSQQMLDRWLAAGLGVGMVQRIAGRLPGLYLIELAANGERAFHFWRSQSAARAYFDAATTPLEARGAEIDLLYLSGISLAILDTQARERLFALMGRLRARGAQVVFDNNYRPRLWPSAPQARAVFDRAFALASTALITLDDHQLLYGHASLADAQAAAQQLAPAEIIIKRGAEPTLVRGAGEAWAEAPTEPVARVVDTTAAGDSFGAGYLSRRLQGASALDAATFGNCLAARVIQHPGAIIPAEAMLDLMES